MSHTVDRHCTNIGSNSYYCVTFSDLSELEFEDICEETLDSLTDKFEDLSDLDFTDSQYDVEFAVSIFLYK